MQEKLARLHFGLDVCVEELPEEQKKAAADRNLDQLLAHVSVTPVPCQRWDTPRVPSGPSASAFAPTAGRAQQLHVSLAGGSGCGDSGSDDGDSGGGDGDSGSGDSGRGGSDSGGSDSGNDGSDERWQ